MTDQPLPAMNSAMGQRGEWACPRRLPNGTEVWFTGSATLGRLNQIFGSQEAAGAAIALLEGEFDLNNLKFMARHQAVAERNRLQRIIDDDAGKMLGITLCETSLAPDAGVFLLTISSPKKADCYIVVQGSTAMPEAEVHTDKEEARKQGLSMAGLDGGLQL